MNEKSKDEIINMLINALEFYADPQTYTSYFNNDYGHGLFGDFDYISIDKDEYDLIPGMLARATLADKSLDYYQKEKK